MFLWCMGVSMMYGGVALMYEGGFFFFMYVGFVSVMYGGVVF